MLPSCLQARRPHSHLQDNSIAKMSRQDAKSDLPKSKSEAESHISQIREEIEKAKGSGLASVVDNAIGILSDDLYQKPSHFVLEFLQNADDSQYYVSEPTLEITLRDDTIRFDSNEVGFTRSNVNALCSLGDSSKVRSYRMTGHKGIGFKSAFKVADKVWIKSGHYSFMFDAGQRLGTLNPIWTRFPDKERKGYSSIRLQFRHKLDISTLADELSSLDAKLLLFLRRIKCIKIQVFKKGAQRILRCQDVGIDKGLRQLTLDPGYSSPFLVSSHRTLRLGHDKRRKGWKYSDILIAFPKAPSGQPLRETQNVYSFLPIRNYGFKFIIQADFLLTASREDIDSSSDWNLKLRDELPRALLTAINRFNSRSLCDAWLPHLIFDNNQPGFFEDLGQDVLKLLSKQPISKSITGDLKPPSELTRIPASLTNTDGGSMFPRAFFQYTLVSPELTSQFATALDGLGVRTFSDDEFLIHLSYFIQTCPRVFQSQPPGWHSRLASILFRLARIELHRDRVAKLPIILLQDGQWVNLDAGQLLLPLTSSIGPVPKGIPAFEVHRHVSQDSFRLRLIQEFGAKPAGVSTICDIIIKTHEGMKSAPQKFETDNLVSHIVFLYRAQWSPSSASTKIWFVGEDGCCHRGDSMYADSGLEYSAGMLFTGEHRSQFPFLHNKYRSAFCSVPRSENMMQWKKWIQEFGITDFPRLVSTVPGDKGAFVLSRDFRYLMDHTPSRLVLRLLKDNWIHYYQWIMDTPADAAGEEKKLSRERLRSELSGWFVQCHNDSVEPLGKTYLPRLNVLVGLGVSTVLSQLQDRCHEYPFLDISDPEDSGWDFLKYFNVAVELKPVHFLNRLMDLQWTDTTRDDVSLLYDQLVACEEDREDSQVGIISKSFKEENLIFIPPTEDRPGRWVGVDECIWDGFPCLKKIPDLKSHYPSNRHEILFRTYLKIPVANLHTLVSEVQQVTSSDSLDYIRDLFITTSRRITAATFSEYKDAAIFQRLNGLEIWPTTTSGPNDGFENLMSNDDVWYIPDHDHLRYIFADKLPFLAFGATTLSKIDQLLSFCGVQRRNISKMATSSTTTQGQVHFMAGYTKALKAKAGCLARLVPLNHQGRSTILRQLATIQVYQAPVVSMQWFVVTQMGNVVYGREEPGRVCVEKKPDGLDIYLVSEESNIHCPPLELAEELAACCGIDNPEHVQMLTHVLLQQDVKRIYSDLDRRGVPNDVGGFDITQLNPLEPMNAPSELDNHPENPTIPVQSSTKRHDQQLASSASDVVETTESVEDQRHHKPVNTQHKTKSIGYGVVPLSMSMPEWFAPGGYSEKEDNFIGQLYVSSFLREVVGDRYKPSIHWTSPLRAMAGHSPFHDDDADISTFTVQDSWGQLKKFLMQQGFQAAAVLVESAIFHIETIVKDGPIDSGFPLQVIQAKKAERLSFERPGHTPSTEAFILAVVCNLRHSPQVLFFEDPWRHYHSGSLSLEAFGDYWACFDKNARPLHVRDTANAQPSSSGRSGTYRYRALRAGEMRLFKLSAGKDKEPLQGTVHHVLVDSSKDYQALSYVWGDISSLAPHSIDTPEGALQVTFSLHSALLAIRDPKVDMLLWIDAICIDQKSVTEKAMQIRLLSTIFQSAGQVVAWLGPESQSENGGMVIENLKDIITLARQSESTYWHKFLESRKLKNQSQGYPVDTWADLDAFLDRPWFKRVWIVQELVLPANVILVCGKLRMGWDDFFEAIQLCEKGLNSGGSQQIDHVQVFRRAGPAYALGVARKRLQRTNKKFPFLQLLDIFSHCHATKRIDKLFALLGLGSDCDEEDFNPDYDSTVQQVIQRYAIRFVRSFRVMDLLCRAGMNKSYDFCSWIPEWTRHNFPQTISTWGASRGSFYAGRREHPTAQVRETSDSGVLMLQISGLSVDRITSVTPISEIRLGADHSGAANDFRKWIEFIDSYPSKEDKRSALLRLPIGDAKRPHMELTADRLRAYRDFAKQEFPEWPSNLEELVWGDRKRSPGEEKVVRQYWQTSQAFMNRISEAAFCRTERGYAGLVPGGSRKGDKICIFDGGKAPFVLRKGKGREFTLVGECYIHGLMYGQGEALQGTEERLFCIV